MRTRLFLSLLVLACSVLLAAVALTVAQDKLPGQLNNPAKQRVALKDGRVFTGPTVVEGQSIKVITPTGEMTFTRDEVLSIKDVVSPKDAYLQKRSAIDARDPKALYDLANWVWQEYPDDIDLLNLAERDLDAALKIKDDYTLAKLLKRQIAAKVKLLESGQESRKIRTGPAQGLLEKELLSQRDVLWVRLMELQPGEGVRIKYENDALRRYIDAMRGQELSNWDRPGKEERFLAMPRNEQVAEILRNMPENWALLKDIHVLHDPKFMRDFRTRIWPMVQRSCAGANCHGGPAPKGSLKFYNVAGNADRVDYTNFVILTGWRKGGKWLIDRNNIEDSLLLQYGLNRKISKNWHPGPEIRPLFTSQRVRSYRLVLEWARQLKGPMHPNYHVDWKPPYSMPIDTTGKPAIPD